MRFLLPLLLVLFASPALACAPCAKQLTLDETLKGVDTVIIGKRTDSSKKERPETIEIEIEAVLKGKVTAGTTVTVKSWTGICPFGIMTATDAPAVFLLKEKDGMLDALDGGCAVKSLPYENGFITVDNSLVGVKAPGSEVLSLKAFVKRFLPEIAE